MRLHRLAISFAVVCASAGAAAQPIPVSGLARPRTTFAEPFSRVAAVREEPDGRLLVLDDLENRIVRVDLKTGTAIPIGRPGPGPGEYTLPMSLLPLAADTTLAVDMSGGGRALVIAARGASPRPLASAGFSGGAPLFYRDDIQTDARGNLYELVTLTSPPDRQAGLSGIRRLDRASGRLDTIGRVSLLVRSPLRRAGARPGNEASRMPSGGPPPPYASVDQWAVAPDGRIAIVSVEPYRVHFIERSGRRVDGPELRYTPEPMSAALKAAWREREEQTISRIVRAPGGAMSVNRTRRTYREPSEWPDELPAFLRRALRFAPDGMLWVERAGPAGAGQVFDMIDVRGAIVRRVVLAQGLRLVGLGRSGVYTVRRDADDLEFLQLHALTP